jgi:hypothetical protein
MTPRGINGLSEVGLTREVVFAEKRKNGEGFVVPETLTQPDIQMHHDEVAAGHQAIIRTADLLNGVCEGVTNRGGNGDSSN